MSEKCTIDPEKECIGAKDCGYTNRRNIEETQLTALGLNSCLQETKDHMIDEYRKKVACATEKCAK